MVCLVGWLVGWLVVSSSFFELWGLGIGDGDGDWRWGLMMIFKF